MNRCLNNFFAYCNGIPNIITESSNIKYLDLAGKEQIKKGFYNQCSLSPKTCGQMATQSELPLIKNS